MDSTQLAEIEARAKAATEGGWKELANYLRKQGIVEPNCLLVETARQDIPDLIAEVRRARQAEQAAYERAAQKAETFFDWCAPIGEHANMAMAQDFAKECATAIRALAQEPEKVG